MRRYKVRFHLAQGEHFMHWQVNDTLKETIQYYNPNDVQLVMLDCKLVNRKATALRINQGANKQVCAWVECDRLEVLKADWLLPESKGNPLHFNPRVAPHWYSFTTSQDFDGFGFHALFTIDKQIHLKHN